MAGEFSEERHEWRAKRNREPDSPQFRASWAPRISTGPYELVKGWPKDVSTLPGNEKWTYGAGESVFAESPNRIYALFRGELPKMAPPKAMLLPQAGPSISFPVAGFWRDATTASLPGTGGTDNNMKEWLTAWEGKAPDLGIKGPPYRQLGVDANWENCLVVLDENGNIVETWKQWDKLFRRPHSVYISPYDPDKNVWIVDDNMQVIYKFTHDGKKLLQTIGTPEVEGADATHFNRPTYLGLAAGTGRFSCPNGYTGTRVAKFDKNGKIPRCRCGMKGGPRGGGDTRAGARPSYFSDVHRVAVDPASPSRFCERSATTTAFKCLTTTANISTNGKSTPIRRACTCFTSARAARSVDA